jgi:truncated hemoglobin YjbI
MHWYIGFTDPQPSASPTLFEWAGGLPALTRMTRLLYEKHVPADPGVAAAFASIPPGYPEQEARRIGEIFGGPPGVEDSIGAASGGGASGGGASGGGASGGVASGGGAGHPELTEEQRARWVTLASTAATEAGLPADAEFRAALASFLEWDSRQPPAQTTTDSQTTQPAQAAGSGPDTPQARPAPRWDWTAAGPPDTTVAAGQDAGATPEPAAVTLPGPGEPVSFAAHIKPLFRDKDRQSMSFAFDLWSAADVRTHAAAILDRLRNGSMPCDTTWPADWVEVFGRWTQSGTLD